MKIKGNLERKMSISDRRTSDL